MTSEQPLISGSWPPASGAGTTTTTPQPEPTAANLPSTVNPLEFLIQDVWRNNATVVRIRNRYSQDGIGLQNAGLFRKILAPWKMLLCLFELLAEEETITLSDQTSGDDQSPFSAGEPVTEAVSLEDKLSETVAVGYIEGVCQ
jgi:hypothetical protein